MASIYAANALAWQVRQHNKQAAPYSLAWALGALPKSKALRPLILKVFSTFVRARVRVMRRRQIAYNSQGLRHDGNYKLAKILIDSVDGMQCTVVFALCGVDGSLIDVPAPLPTEAWPHIVKVLDPLLREIQQVRLECGFGLLESMPVFHSTDSYKKHARRMRKLYACIWEGLRLTSEGDTPKGPAKRRKLLPAEWVEGFCTITGEPMHCIINLRKLVSPQCNDARNFISDYTEIVNRLSKEDAPAVFPEDSGALPVLSTRAVALLKKAVQCSADEFALARDDPAEAASLEQLRLFICHSAVCGAAVWKRTFRATPPRGALARIAYRLDVQLHPANGSYGWSSKRAFREEVRRLRKWYKPGRRQTRRRFGIIRDARVVGSQVRGRQSVVTAKIRKHLRNLVSTRQLEGLWHWRRMAQALRMAGIPMQTGTVPVERLWSSLLAFFPEAGRRMSRPWWDLLAMLSYMRFNYRHFNHSTLPTFVEGDALLGERIDMLVSLTRELQKCSEGDDYVLRALEAALA